MKTVYVFTADMSPTNDCCFLGKDLKPDLVTPFAVAGDYVTDPKRVKLIRANGGKLERRQCEFVLPSRLIAIGATGRHV